MLCDFYGNVLVPPSVVAHRRPDFAQAVKRLRETMGERSLQEVLVAVERTGRYHHPVKRAFAGAGFEVRTVHPLATKQFRQPSDPGNKTDDTDLIAIHRCAVNGFALMEPSLDEFWQELQLLIRHRRDLVGKASALCCQIREHLEAAMPGYAACSHKLWQTQAALHRAWKVGSAEAMRQGGLAGVVGLLRKDGLRFQERTVRHALEWADTATGSDLAAEQHRSIARALNDDRGPERAGNRGPRATNRRPAGPLHRRQTGR